MLIVSLDRWPGGVVRIAWRHPEEGVHVLVVEPGRGMSFCGRADAARVPYVVRDIAETVRLGGGGSVRSAQFCATEAIGAVGGVVGGAGGGWWAAACQAARHGVEPEAFPRVAENWAVPPSPRPFARLMDWLSRLSGGRSAGQTAANRDRGASG